ncbi:MAG: nitroreductase family protein, partial [Candidatus Thermoplasmatota archaeon]|nr:nitroreductase family protein [Candidatus Thermoplasmatota archaeon]
MTRLQDVINNRRSIYQFTDEIVDDEILQQALLAASNAPCHKHTHPWKFYILGNDIRKKLIPTITKLANIKSEKMQSKNFELDVERAINKILQPPLLVAV